MTPRSLAAASCLACALVHLSATAAPEPASAPRIEITDAFPGVSIFSPGRWGIVGVTILNPTDRPADLLSAHYFAGNPDLQFARRLWVPPRARLTSWYPVLPPESPVRTMRHLDVKSLLIDRSGKREVLLKNPSGTMIHDGILPSQTDQGPVTGLIADLDDQQAALPASVARLAFNMSPRLIRFSGDALPPTVESLQALNQLIVADDRLAGDPAGICAVRQWLHGGGTLWVMLDRVSPATVSLLLGEDFPCTVLDRVQLSQWQFIKHVTEMTPDDETADLPGAPPAPADAASLRFEGRVDDFEGPCEMVRLLAPGMEPMHTIGGWPASFWQRYGRGKALFTTLAPRGWVLTRPREEAARMAAQDPFPLFQASEPLRQLGGYFLRSRKNLARKSLDFEPLLVEQIGYRIVQRGTVVAVLGTFCFGLLAVGVWLGRRGHLAHLAWVGPGAALLAALVLVVVGNESRRAVAATVAMGQLAEIVPGAEDAPVTGLLALYNPEDSSAPLGAERGGIFLPELRRQGGRAERMVWTDLDRWHWENLSLGPGLHLARFEASARLGAPLSARTTFGPEGIVGKLDLGQLQELGDAILALPLRGNFAVRLHGTSGNFTAHPGDRLAGEQFLTASVLSDEQRRRQAVYRRLFDRSAVPRYPLRPMFLAWASPLDLGFTLGTEVRHSGSALVAIPLEMERPAPGTHVVVPGAFMTYRCVAVDGRLTSLYDPRLSEWVRSMKSAAKTMLRFQVPRELLPLRVERAAMTVDINAQARSFTVFAPGPGFEALATHRSPVGRLHIDIDRANILRPDADGGIYLGLSISAAQKLPWGFGGSSEWKIDDLQLELAGQTLEP